MQHPLVGETFKMATKTTQITEPFILALADMLIALLKIGLDRSRVNEVNPAVINPFHAE